MKSLSVMCLRSVADLDLCSKLLVEIFREFFKTGRQRPYLWNEFKTPKSAFYIMNVRNARNMISCFGCSKKKRQESTQSCVFSCLFSLNLHTKGYTLWCISFFKLSVCWFCQTLNSFHGFLRPVLQFPGKISNAAHSIKSNICLTLWVYDRQWYKQIGTPVFIKFRKRWCYAGHAPGTLHSEDRGSGQFYWVPGYSASVSQSS